MIRKIALAAVLAATPAAAEPTKLLWGDTHLHTRVSFDAFLNGNVTADPDTAYRFAKGEPVIHPGNRARVQLDRPLDFLVVSDHAELMGVMYAAYFDEGLPELGWWDSLKRWGAIWIMKRAVDSGGGPSTFRSFLPKTQSGEPGSDPVADPNNEMPTGIFGPTEELEQNAWNEIVDAAERHNKPGEFTALLGWEWSSIPTGANLHRVVITPADGKTAKEFLPYGSDDSQYPTDLWKWMQETEARLGAPFIAIPHNSNISKGYMFADTQLTGEPMTAEYAKLRAIMEPVVEVTQYKGDSETHPQLSPNDPFADFETYTNYIQNDMAADYKVAKGDFVRSALMTGLEIEAKIGENPYQFGLIGSTDAHTGLAAADEDNYHGKMPTDSVPEAKLGSEDAFRKGIGWQMAAQGYAAVWAEENTRQSIFEAFQRRETYSTSGPRMALRVFGGYGFDPAQVAGEGFVAHGYQAGVPMGGELLADAEGRAPQFLIRAVKDPLGANLDRVQIVKGWLGADGVAQEKVFNVVWSDGRAMKADGSIPPVGSTVNMNTGKTLNTIGATDLSVLWQDPEYQAGQRAFYYVRVLQIPTVRHGQLDNVALQGAEEEWVGKKIIQERAYSSPIWVHP